MTMGHPAPICASCASVSRAPSVSAPARVDINCLSNEIILQIIQWVGDDRVANPRLQIQRHLPSLALCSRRFHKLAEPVLYSGFRQSFYEPESDANFFSYLKRILASPHLARCLKLFSGAARSNDKDSLLPVASELTDPDWMRLRTAIYEASTSTDEAAIWIRAVEKGEWNAVVALLLAVAPSVEEIEFTNWSYKNDDYPHLMRFLDGARNLQDLAIVSPFALSKLRSVSLRYPETDEAFAFDVMEPFLLIKSVKVFHGCMISGNSFDTNGGSDPGLIDPPLNFMTRDLTFKSSAISPRDMVLILQRFPRLENFHYDLCGALVSYDSKPPLRREALEHLKPCLKNLTFLLQEHYDMSEIEILPIGSLADFPKLVSITTNASFLIGEGCSDTEDYGSDDSERVFYAKSHSLVDVVPPTLESLSLYNCSEGIVHHIFELVSEKKCRTPVLRKIDLGWEGVRYPDKESPQEPIVHRGFSKEEAGKLRMSCEVAGIEIAIKYLPPKPKYVSFTKPGEPLDGKSVALGFWPIPITIMRHFPYPYEGYEEYCKENGCNPETGRRMAV